MAHPMGSGGVGGVGSIPPLEGLNFNIGDYLKQLPGMGQQAQPMAKPSMPQAVQFNTVQPGKQMSPTERLAQIMRIGAA